MKYITIIIAITGICFFACKHESVQKPQKDMSVEESGVVKTVPVERYAESAHITALGIVLSESEAKPSFKTGGVISKTFVKEGDIVRKGQLLATLLMDEIDAQVLQAEEGLIKAERDRNRVSNLYADSVATLEQYQNATTGYEMARRNADIARFNRAYSEVRSPISGKIVKQIMRTGEVTGPGTPVFAIIGIGSQDWVIKAGLVDRDWARVKVRDKVRITMDAYPGKIFDGYISDKSSVGGSASGTFDVEIKLTNQPATMAAGLTANISISTADNETYDIIPIEALVKTNGNSAYAFSTENGKARKIRLTIARLLGDKVAISHGLEGVKAVVTTGAMYLEDGDTVRGQ
jgi:RND family efflux transporter MFP subunit